MQEKGLATAVATLLAAFATAHLMQFGLSAGRAISGEPLSAPIGLATLVASRGTEPSANLPPTPVPAPDPVPVAFAIPGARTAPQDVAIPAILGAVRDDSLGLSCVRKLTLTPLRGAVIEARLEAPCDRGVRVEVSHAGLRFALSTGPDGSAISQIPALMPEAIVEARFADGTTIAAHADAPEAANFERVVLVADGWGGLALHAAETASWRGQLRLSSIDASPPRGGHIVRLGDPTVEAPLLADVYTAPAGRLGAFGGAALRIEVALSPHNCARDVGAEIIRSSGGVGPSSTPVRLSLPACDGDGGVLVLDLPSPGLRLARN